MTALFFSDDPVDIARAKAICAKCPIRRNCLDAALERGEPHGVWGGALLEAGAITTKRPTGRPPKRPRVELVTDELGTVIERATTVRLRDHSTTTVQAQPRKLSESAPIRYSNTIVECASHPRKEAHP